MNSLFGSRSAGDGGPLSVSDNVMPPKKKQRISGGNEVPAVQASLDKWLQSTYELRHAQEDESMSPVHPWPVLHGGTFLDVANRGWLEVDKLVSSVHKLVLRAGLMAPDSSETEFLSKYCTMEAGRCWVSSAWSCVDFYSAIEVSSPNVSDVFPCLSFPWPDKFALRCARHGRHSRAEWSRAPSFNGVCRQILFGGDSFP